MALSYEFSIGSVRAKEKSLFSDAEIEQMLALQSETEMVRFLKDKGYGEGSDVEEIIESSKELMWKYIRSVAPDFTVFSPFLIQNDVHNLKTILKGVMSEREYEGLFQEPATIETKELIKAVENRRFDKLPLWIGESADKAYQILAETKDARISDALLDRALMERLLFEGKKSRSVFLDQYFSTMVFYANVKIAIRGTKSAVSSYYFEQSLCDDCGLDKKKIIRLSVQGVDALVKYLETISAYNCREAMDVYKNSASEFEKYTENLLIRLAKQLCRYASEGPEPLIGYYIARKYERKLIHIIASGIKTKTPPDRIRERLREIYG